MYMYICTCVSACMPLLAVILQQLRICLPMSMHAYARITEYAFGCVCEIVHRMHMLHVLQKILNVRLRVYTHVCVCVCVRMCPYVCIRARAGACVRACVYSRMRIVYAHVLFLCMCVVGLHVYVNAVNV